MFVSNILPTHIALCNVFIYSHQANLITHLMPSWSVKTANVSNTELTCLLGADEQADFMTQNTDEQGGALCGCKMQKELLLHVQLLVKWGHHTERREI